MTVFGINNFKLQIAEGNVPGVALFGKFGVNRDIDTGSDPEDVVSWGGLYEGFLDANTSVEVVSENEDDTSAGSGARVVVLTQLTDENGDALEDIEVTLNGGTASVGTQITGCTRMYVKGVGSGGVNAGDITLRVVGSGEILCQVPAGLGQSQIALYRVPTGKTLYLDGAEVAMSRANGSAGAASVTFFIRAGAGFSWRSVKTLQITDSHGYRLEGRVVLTLPARYEMRWHVSEVTDNNTEVSAQFEGYLVDN